MRRLRNSDIAMTPILNLFVILIPFLLLSASFIQLATLRSTVSEIGSGESKELKLNLILAISTRDFFLMSSGVDLDAVIKKQQVLAGKGKLVISNHDFDELEARLQMIKKLFPNETAISIAPGGQVSYQLVVRTMDRVTGFVGNPLFSNIAFTKLMERF